MLLRGVLVHGPKSHGHAAILIFARWIIVIFVLVNDQIEKMACLQLFRAVNESDRGEEC